MAKTRKQRRQRKQRKQRNQRTQRKQRGKGLFSSCFGSSCVTPGSRSVNGPTRKRILHQEILELQDELRIVEKQIEEVQAIPTARKKLSILMNNMFIIQNELRPKLEELAEIELAEPKVVSNPLRTAEGEPLVLV